jgi:hypothetical protein
MAQGSTQRNTGPADQGGPLARGRGARHRYRSLHGREDLSNAVFRLGWATHLAADSNVVHPEVAARDCGAQWLLGVYNNEEPLAPLPPLLKRYLSHPLHAEAGKDSYQSRARPAEYRPMGKQLNAIRQLQLNRGGKCGRSTLRADAENCKGTANPTASGVVAQARRGRAQADLIL